MKLKELIKEADERKQSVEEWMETHWGDENKISQGLKKWERYLDLINTEVEVLPKKHRCKICGVFYFDSEPKTNIHDTIHNGRCSKCRGK